MIAKNLINEAVPPLKPSDNGEKALSWMGSFHVQHLPVVDGQQYLGMVAEYDILDTNHADMPLRAYSLDLTRNFVYDYVHIYDVLKVVNENRLSAIPVLDENDQYVGLITLETLLDFFAKTNAMQEPGGIIILEISINDYTASEIARIVESNNAKILSMYVTSPPSNNMNLEVTLKINRTDLQAVMATFERYDYMVKASYQEDSYLEDMQERLDAFMNYLSI